MPYNMQKKKRAWETGGRCTHGAISPHDSGVDMSSMAPEFGDNDCAKLKAKKRQLEILEIDKS